MSDAIYQVKLWNPPVKDGEPQDVSWEIENLTTGAVRRGVDLDPAHSEPRPSPPPSDVDAEDTP